MRINTTWFTPLPLLENKGLNLLHSTLLDSTLIQNIVDPFNIDAIFAAASASGVTVFLTVDNASTNKSANIEIPKQSMHA